MGGARARPHVQLEAGAADEDAMVKEGDVDELARKRACVGM
jgi:hypothetical protein